MNSSQKSERILEIQKMLNKYLNLDYYTLSSVEIELVKRYHKEQIELYESVSNKKDVEWGHYRNECITCGIFDIEKMKPSYRMGSLCYIYDHKVLFTDMNNKTTYLINEKLYNYKDMDFWSIVE